MFRLTPGAAQDPDAIESPVRPQRDQRVDAHEDLIDRLNPRQRFNVNAFRLLDAEPES